MARCLVLGANGFIGSHLVDSLARSGHSVRAFGRFAVPPVFNDSDAVEIFKGDFLNQHDLVTALDGIEYVFHYISTTTPASAEDDPLIDVNTNIHMSIILFQACVEAGVKRVIFASTGGAIYGNTGRPPHKESDAPQPVSPYAIGKLTIEHYLHYFRVKHGLDSVVLRISNPYGERQPFARKQGVIPIFLERVFREESITVYGDGSMIRDYVYVGDVASATARMFDQPLKHFVYNVGSGEGESVSTLIDVIQRVSGKTCSIEHRPVPSTFVQEVVLDTSRFSDEFGPVATTSLDDGITRTYQYITNELHKEG